MNPTQPNKKVVNNVSLEWRDLLDSRLISVIIIFIALITMQINYLQNSAQIQNNDHLQEDSSLPNSSYNHLLIPTHSLKNVTHTLLNHTMQFQLISTWPAQIMLIYDFLSAQECEELINLGNPLVEPSYVAEPGTGRRLYTADRNSYTHYFKSNSHSLIQTLEQRLAIISGIPIQHQSGLNFIRYFSGQKFGLHYDSKEYNRIIHAEGMRFYSNLVYLNNVEEGLGGETYWPYLDLKVNPKQGLAVFWSNVNSDGKMNPIMLHAGLPLNTHNNHKETVKYVANMFVKEGGSAESGSCSCSTCNAYRYSSSVSSEWGINRALHLQSYSIPLTPFSWSSLKSNT